MAFKNPQLNWQLFALGADLNLCCEIGLISCTYICREPIALEGGKGIVTVWVRGVMIRRGSYGLLCLRREC